MPPIRVDARGRRTVRTTLCTPLEQHSLHTINVTLVEAYGLKL